MRLERYKCYITENHVIVLWAEFDCIWAKFCMKDFCVYYSVG
jgi:hypothetical protein